MNQKRKQYFDRKNEYSHWDIFDDSFFLANDNFESGSNRYIQNDWSENKEFYRILFKKKNKSFGMCELKTWNCYSRRIPQSIILIDFLYQRFSLWTKMKNSLKHIFGHCLVSNVNAQEINISTMKII